MVTLQTSLSPHDNLLNAARSPPITSSAESPPTPGLVLIALTNL